MSTDRLTTKQQIKYLAKNGFWVISTFTFTLLSGLLISSLFSRIWPPEIYGSYSFLLSIIGFLSLTALPGMGQALLQAAANSDDGFYDQSIKILTKKSFVGSAILFAFSIYYLINQNITLSISFALAGIIFPLNTASNLYISFLNGKGLFKQSSIISITVQIITLILISFSLLYFPYLIIVTLVSLYIPNLLSYFINIYQAAKHKKHPKNTKNYLNLASGLSKSQLFTIGSDYIDRLITPLLLGFTDFAIYSFATLIPLQIHQLLKTITSILEPKIALLKDHNINHVFHLRILIFFFIVAIIVLLYILLSPVLFIILYPNYKSNSLLLSQIFALSLLYYPFNIFALVLVKKHQTPSLTKINIIYAISTILSLSILALIFGLIGAVVSKILSRLIYSAAIYFYFLKATRRQS